MKTSAPSATAAAPSALRSEIRFEIAGVVLRLFPSREVAEAEAVLIGGPLGAAEYRQVGPGWVYAVQGNGKHWFDMAGIIKNGATLFAS